MNKIVCLTVREEKFIEKFFYGNIKEDETLKISSFNLRIEFSEFKDVENTKIIGKEIKLLYDVEDAEGKIRKRDIEGMQFYNVDEEPEFSISGSDCDPVTKYCRKVMRDKRSKERTEKEWKIIQKDTLDAIQLIHTELREVKRKSCFARFKAWLFQKISNVWVWVCTHYIVTITIIGSLASIYAAIRM